jgi:hypothetical protein
MVDPEKIGKWRLCAADVIIVMFCQSSLNQAPWIWLTDSGDAADAEECKTSQQTIVASWQPHFMK